MDQKFLDKAGIHITHFGSKPYRLTGWSDGAMGPSERGRERMDHWYNTNPKGPLIPRMRRWLAERLDSLERWLRERDPWGHDDTRDEP